MTYVRANEFDGLVPRTEAHELSDNQAQVAQNTKLYARELRAFRGPLTEGTAPAGSVSTIYKLYNYAGAYQWLQWAFDVDVALSPTSDNGDIRFYLTGFGIPKQSNYALIAGNSYQQLGIPAPIAAATLTPTVPGTGTAQTRAYVYTFVNTFGAMTQEGPPSPAQTVTVNSTGSTVTVSLMDSPPLGYSGNITARRIYRSVTGASSATYEFVAEVPIATGTYDDTLTIAQLGAALDTLGWLGPPTDLKGIVNLGSTGVLAGFSGNTVCFSEPFFPHAWPIAYQLTVPFKIVGIGTLGSSLIVMTSRYPYIITGGTPGAMSMEKVPILEPCVSKKSIVSVEDGVVYASPNGLVTLGTSGRGNTVHSLYRRDEWQALGPSNMIGAVLDGRYYGCFPSGPMAGKAIVLDKGDRPALCQIDMSGPQAVHTDSEDAKIYYVNAGRTAILQLDADANNLLTYTWRSKKWYLPTDISWSVARVRADYTAGAATVMLYADGNLVATIAPTSDAAIRLPPFRAREFMFEIVGTRSIRSVTFATSVAELGP